MAAGVLILERVPSAAVWSTFRLSQGVWLWLALASVMAMLAIRYLKWHRLLAAAKLQSSRCESAESLLGGFALSIITPGRVGELGRCLFVGEADRASVFLLNILDRALDLWALLTCAVASLFLLVSRPAALFAVAVWLAFLPIVLGLPTLIAGAASLPWWRETFRVQLRQAGQNLSTVRPASFAAWSLVSTSLDLITFFFLLRAFLPVEFPVALATFPWVVMAGGLPVSLSGLGAREGVAALLLARYTIPAVVAVDTALLLFVFSALLPALLGGVALLWPRSQRPTWSCNLESLVWRRGAPAR